MSRRCSRAVEFDSCARRSPRLSPRSACVPTLYGAAYSVTSSLTSSSMSSSRGSSRSGSFSSRSSGELPHTSRGLAHSTSVLILVPDTEDQDDSNSFPFSDDDEESPFLPEATKTLSATPLPPHIIFLYLLSPCLKLGAMLVPNRALPLKLAIPSLMLFSLLSAFASQIWFMLARYVRKTDLADIISEALAPGRGQEERRKIIGALVRSGNALLRVLLATVYLRGKCVQLTGVCVISNEATKPKNL